MGPEMCAIAEAFELLPKLKEKGNPLFTIKNDQALWFDKDKEKWMHQCLCGKCEAKPFGADSALLLTACIRLTQSLIETLKEEAEKHRENAEEHKDNQQDSNSETDQPEHELDIKFATPPPEIQQAIIKALKKAIDNGVIPPPFPAKPESDPNLN